MVRLLPAAAVLASLVIAGAFAMSAGGQSPTETPSPSATPTPDSTETPAFEPTPSEVPTATPFVDLKNPGPWVPPPGYAGSLHPGVWVTITGTETCLNVRSSPGITDDWGAGPIEVPILNCLPDGFIGQLSFGPGNDWYGEPLPVQHDGHWWWNILGQGWVAEDWLVLLQEDGSPYAPRPELAGTGLIAFSRADGIWLGSADGTSSRLAYPLADGINVRALRWSPDGHLLAVGRDIYDDGSAVSVVDIIDINGSVIQSFPGLAEPNWSPDGARLSAISTSDFGGLGGYQGTNVIVDRATEVETVIAPLTTGYTAPEWSPDGSSLALVCVSTTWQEWLPDNTVVDHVVDCGGSGLFVVSAVDGSKRLLVPFDSQSGAYYMSPSWSPDGGTIAAYSGGSTDCDGHTLFDVTTGARLTCFALPTASQIGGMCGGSAESGASDWSPDGSQLAYHWQFRTGQNGVALVDVATGDRKMIQTTGASSISFSGDGAHLAFSASGYVWTADSDATDVQRLAEGHLPAWQPVP